MLIKNQMMFDVCLRTFLLYLFSTQKSQGENTLHIAIVNEDPAMVKYLLDAGANVSERCFGSFMSPEGEFVPRSNILLYRYISTGSEDL